LNLEFTKGLEAAFEQANCMFRANMDLAIKNYEKPTKSDRASTYFRYMVVVGSLVR
jgi:hypothetical protein